MKTVRIACTWRTTHEIEVPDDWEVPSTLDGFSDEALEDIDSHAAELIDWGKA